MSMLQRPLLAAGANGPALSSSLLLLSLLLLLLVVQSKAFSAGGCAVRGTRVDTAPSRRAQGPAPPRAARVVRGLPLPAESGARFRALSVAW